MILLLHNGDKEELKQDHMVETITTPIPRNSTMRKEKDIPISNSFENLTSDDDDPNFEPEEAFTSVVGSIEMHKQKRNKKRRRKVRCKWSNTGIGFFFELSYWTSVVASLHLFA